MEKLSGNTSVLSMKLLGIASFKILLSSTKSITKNKQKYARIISAKFLNNLKFR